MKKVPGLLSISQTHNGYAGDYISIRISDALSSLPIVEAAMDYEAFAKCVTGMAFMHAQLRVDDTFDRVGLIRRTLFSKVMIPWSNNSRDNEDDVIKDIGQAVEQLPEYADGWRLLNTGLHSRDGVQRHGEHATVSVTLVRYEVPTEEEVFNASHL